MNLSKENIKSIIIGVLVCVIVFGGSYISSELSYYKKNCLNNKIDAASTAKFNVIGISDYMSLFSSNDLTLIYIGKDDCTYSQAQDVVFESLVDKYDMKVNYLNLSTLDDSAIEALYSSYDTFINDGLSTPTIMLVQNGEVKLFKKGYTSLENLITLLKENKFIVEQVFLCLYIQKQKRLRKNIH